MTKIISGFSKLTKEEKIQWLAANYFSNQPEIIQTIKQYWNVDEKLQQLHDDFIENTITNFYIPYGVAPNFVINNREYVIPMVVEESSVVAAASKVAKYWSTRGGFKTEVIGTTKIGQVHFMYAGDKAELETYFNKNKTELFAATASITKNMEKRGGGILDIKLIDKTEKLANYYQLHVTFETKDSMGANFINSCLEVIAKEFEKEDVEIVMSILSNNVPECLVRAEVSCKVEALGGENPEKFAQKFEQAVKIAEIEPYRAVTHNKGIMNGIDAVVLATGNDFRAIEAGAHAYAARDGEYKSLTHCTVKEGVFKFWIEVPLALGTVGGLTALHPMAKLSLDLMQKPSARVLMQIIASAGLAQNFAALRALTTKGIQHGHMKMHLQNILNQLGATKEEKEEITTYFDKRTVSHSAVVTKFKELRKPTISWVNFLDEVEVTNILSTLKVETKPLFGKMNAQQMIEHLSAVTQIANGNWKVDSYVSDDKQARRKPYLNTGGELQVGFKAPFLAEDPIELKFESIAAATNDLIEQVKVFESVFAKDKNRSVVHPFFGELDYEYWKKFQVKHFTHHFKQFGLI
ncbi:MULTISPECIES: hydroxymethylglutaryl-CoA reductase, degradative [Tenacibaculum]|uniref:hydroxymethylglutaryl-CoA reductase, degradative n=1 Tax=Tenacibaculum TaxID=104267 RepID=UPI001F0B24B8|nr:MULTISPECIES: hydroxymethylglutaryl-CoA reductase, degradative [Tenacibaculum]MCH3880902.1 hydroxymethylglutaryl-CoA reductase, degradative [Tenacibaculum aquimarinum]MCH3884220.1 hydroxymethylglutaryl-CoA reductase, degradative [Tenacibaculum aquimarinum]MDO6599498.1 hydroxymethylglutaryl-CoA reductase, degradative [Tenacibaculum sp. 1_MG-2023]